MEFSTTQVLALSKLRDNTTREILYGGAAGGGKSLLGCYWIINNCFKYPGTRWLVGRSELKNLKETTLNTLFEVLRMLNILPGEHYRYNEHKSAIYFKNNSEILLKDLFQYPRDPNFDSLGSLEISGAFIDEANQITHKAKSIVMSRIRYKLRGIDANGNPYKLMPKMFMTCNPALNWTFSEFYEPWDKGELDPRRCFIPSLVTDNPFIDPNYVENLKMLPEVDQERLLRGNWRYDNDPYRLIEYEKILDMWHNAHVEEGDKWLTCDIALHGADKFVMILWSGYRIKRLFALDKCDPKEVEEFIRNVAKSERVPLSHIIYDSDGIGSYLRGYIKNAKPFVNNSKAVKEVGKPQNYQNLKTQCYYLLADKIMHNEIYIENEAIDNFEYKEDLIRDLQMVKRDKVDDDKKLHILSKKDIREAIGRSPDFSDAMMMRMFADLNKNRIVGFKLPY